MAYIPHISFVERKLILLTWFEVILWSIQIDASDGAHVTVKK